MERDERDPDEEREERDAILRRDIGQSYDGELGGGPRESAEAELEELERADREPLERDE